MSGHAIENLMDWSRRDEWIEPFEEMLAAHLGPSCQAMDAASYDDLVSLVGIDAFRGVWGCVFEDFLTHESDDGRNIVADYLKRRGFRETASSRAYMNGLRNSVMSLYEVSDVRPGESFLLRDLIRGGDPVRVSEKSGSRQLKAWDRVGARVVPLPTKTVLGGGLLLFDHPTSEEVLKTFRRMRKTLRSEMLKSLDNSDLDLREAAIVATEDDTGVLSLLAPMFTDAWLGHRLENILDPTINKLTNTDGDELLFVTARYGFKPGVTVKAVRTALDDRVSLRRETANFWNWIDYDRPEPPKTTGKKRGLAIGAWLDDGATVLGTVEIRGRAVFLDANSTRRHDTFRAMIEPLLENLVTAPDISAQSLKDIQANSAPGDEDGVPSPPPSDDHKAAIQAWQDNYYRGLITEPVPALGDKTPVEAARTPAGRRKLMAWLKFLENGEARGSATYDFSWMWETLGIADLRR